MAEVECEVEETEEENDNGRMQACVKVTCGDCGHAETSFGTGEKSIRRCLVLLKENCPEGKRNYYTAEGA